VLVMARAHSGAWAPLAAFPSDARGALLAPAPGPEPGALLLAAGARLALLSLATGAGAGGPALAPAAAPAAAALCAGGPLPAWHPGALRALLDRGRPAAAAAALRGLSAWLRRRGQQARPIGAAGQNAHTLLARADGRPRAAAPGRVGTSQCRVGCEEAACCARAAQTVAHVRAGAPMRRARPLRQRLGPRQARGRLRRAAPCRPWSGG
jgi:hypothetical protein